MSESVLIYTKHLDETGPCPFCDQAKSFLSQNAVPFTEVSLYPGERQYLYDQWGLSGSDRTVPQVILTDCMGVIERIGGYDKLVLSRVETLFAEQPQVDRFAA